MSWIVKTTIKLGVLALVPVFFGSGRFSIDAVLERRLLRADANAP